ncbi:hypothetical protein KP509_05G019900 [Ceratopteris richardii]|nr:hypothetical protein KP509_05G019900 [Ceratopteris richardii]
MQRDNVSPNEHTFIYLLSACKCREALSEGKLVHMYILSISFEKGKAIATALVCMYSKCGSIDDALHVFSMNPEKDTIFWNAMISVVSEHGYNREAEYFYEQMLVEGFLPSRGTIVSSLNSCFDYPSLLKVKRIHTRAVICEYDSDVKIANALATAYGKCGSLMHVHAAFQRTQGQNTISWTALMSAYVERRQSRDVIKTLQRMVDEGVIPDQITLASSLTSCIGESSLPDGKWLHCFVCICGFDSDGVVGTALLNMYGKCNSMEDAWRVFNKLPERDVVCWNAMIAVCGQNGYGHWSLALLRQMGMANLAPNKITFISLLDACANEAAIEEGRLLHSWLLQHEIESEHIIGAALVNFYGKCGYLEDAQRMFQKLPLRSLSSWTAIITTYSQRGLGRESLCLFKQMMEEDLVPNEITFVSLLSSCSYAGMTETAWQILYMMQQYYGVTAKSEHFDCLIDLLGRAGLLIQAYMLIDKMPFHPGANTWMAFLGSCKLHNNNHQAIISAEHALEVDSSSAAPYVLLSNIYSTICCEEGSAVFATVEDFVEHDDHDFVVDS